MVPTDIHEEEPQLESLMTPPTLNSSNSTDSPNAVEIVRRYIESLPRPVPFRKEIRNVDFWRALWAEFLVTLLFLVVGCGAEVKWSSRSASQQQQHQLIPNVTCSTADGCPTTRAIGRQQEAVADDPMIAANIKAALAMGLTVTSLVHSTAHVSGCHLNPAVSIGLFVTRNISPLRTVAYVLVQCIGATVGAALLYGLTPPQVRHHGLVTTVLHPDVHPSQAFGVEFLITLMVTITLMASWDQQNSGIGCKALVIGLAYTVGHLFGYPYTGAGMNPARSLALALITNSWKYHWVYWAGPILGGILGGFTYEYIRDSRTSNTPYHLYNFGQPPPQQSQQQQPEVHNEQPWRRRQRESREILKRDQSALSGRDTELSIASNDYRI